MPQPSIIASPDSAVAVQSSALGEAATVDLGVANFSTLLAEVVTGVTTTCDETEATGAPNPEPKANEQDQPTTISADVAVQACAISLILSPAFSSTDQSESATANETESNPALSFTNANRSTKETMDVGLRSGTLPLETTGPLSTNNASSPSLPKPALECEDLSVGAMISADAELNDHQQVASQHGTQANSTSQIDQASKSSDAVRPEHLKGIGPSGENGVSVSADASGVASPDRDGVQGVGKTDNTVTARLQGVARAGASVDESAVIPSRQGENSSSNVDSEAARIETQAFNDHGPYEGHSNLTKQPGGTFREPSELRSSEDKLDQSEATSARFAHVPTDAAVTATPRHETEAKENGAVWRPVVDRVVQEIKTYIQLEKREAVIQLDPPELGRIKINLRVDGDQLQALITTESGHTKTLIENHLGELRQALEISQVGLRSVQVDQQSTPSTGGHSTQAFPNTPQQGQGQGQRGHGDSVLFNRPLHDSMAAEIAPQPQVDQGRFSMWA